MYIVKEYHYRPSYKKGDLKTEEVALATSFFKTMKSAKEYIEKKLIGKKSVWRKYHNSNEKSYCGYYTDKTWTHETSGEICKEYFTFELTKYSSIF